MAHIKLVAILGVFMFVLLSGCAQQEKIAGDKCGTVSPGSRDACCANKNKDIPHVQCVGEWKWIPPEDRPTDIESPECAWVCDAQGGPTPSHCNEYCSRQSHEDCLGSWVVTPISAPYYGPDHCKCEWKCDTGNASIANPASVYCKDSGYELEIRADETGGQYGVCIFPDGSECEEWKFFRGECGKQWDTRGRTIANDTGATAAGVESVVEGNNNFAFDYYQLLDSKETGNIFFSPYSISTALAITYEGSKGNTADEIQSIFGFPEDDLTRRSSFARIYNTINAPSEGYQLSTANALWVEKTYNLLASYIGVARDYYGAKATNLDFIRGFENSRLAINNWVEEQTNYKIKDLIPEGAINPMTRLVITNAVYFKGTWAQQFNESKTTEDDFRVNETQTVKVDMMHMSATEFNYSENDDFQMLELPYEGGELSMLILLPTEDDSTSLDSLSLSTFSELKGGLREREVVVSLPKFKFETTYMMVNDLAEMGMTSAFSPGKADFSGIDGTRSLYISNVIHKAFVEVNEEGTEAAAATAVIFETTSIPMYEYFVADHPFVFIIQENGTGNILFMGRVTDPME